MAKKKKQNLKINSIEIYLLFFTRNQKISINVNDLLRYYFYELFFLGMYIIASGIIQMRKG